MPKCNKVKNPCKICLANVTTKTGIQCQGACQTWVHFDCLNYTPGKIKDVKAGFIKVTCPCPDCKTTMPKEYQTDSPYSCSNMKCPANQLPKCANAACPINGGDRKDQTNKPVAIGCPLDKCGKGCKDNSNPNLPNVPQPPLKPPCAPPSHPLPASIQSSSDACFNACPSGCVSSNEAPGDYGRRSSGQPPNISSVSSLSTLEQMCNTVGQLSNQINCLMNKMREVVQEKGCGRQGCTQKGKACFCPGNPGRQ